MPPLLGAENIRDFIACVAHGMLIGTIENKDATKLLYAAQVAYLALNRPNPKRTPKSAAEVTPSTPKITKYPPPPISRLLFLRLKSAIAARPKTEFRIFRKENERQLLRLLRTTVAITLKACMKTST